MPGGGYTTPGFGGQGFGPGGASDGIGQLPILQALQNIVLALNTQNQIMVTGGTIALPTAVDNILINAFCDIDQSNEGASVSLASGTNKYAIDGWEGGFHSGTAVVTAQRIADAPSGFTNSVKLTVGTGAPVLAGDYLLFQQPIEANEITGTAFGGASAQTLSLTFWIKSSIGSYTASGQLANGAVSRSYPFTFTISAANTWEKKTVSIPGDVTGAWVTSGNTQGMALSIVGANGSTFQGTANTWQAGNFIGTSANTNTLLTTNGATFQMTGAKLEIGSSATALVREPFQLMLARCQRYYEKSYDLGTALGGAGVVVGQMLFQATGAAAGFNGYFKASKRADPTMTFYSPSTGTSAKLRDNVNAADINVAGVGAGMNSFYVQAAPTAGTALNITGHWTADARL